MAGLAIFVVEFVTTIFIGGCGTVVVYTIVKSRSTTAGLDLRFATSTPFTTSLRICWSVPALPATVWYADAVTVWYADAVGWPPACHSLSPLDFLGDLNYCGCLSMSFPPALARRWTQRSYSQLKPESVRRMNKTGGRQLMVFQLRNTDGEPIQQETTRSVPAERLG